MRAAAKRERSAAIGEAGGGCPRSPPHWVRLVWVVYWVGKRGRFDKCNLYTIVGPVYDDIISVISTAVILNGGYNYTNANVYTQYIYSKIERLDTALFLGFMA